MEKILEEKERYDQTYTTKETSRLTGLSIDLLRLYEKEFNLNIQRTKGNHRRYSQDDIELFVDIKKKIQEQNWSYKMVLQWLNGNEIKMESPDVQSELEKKVDLLQDMVQELLTKSKEDDLFKQALIQRLDQQDTYIKESLEKRDQLLLESLAKSTEDRKNSRTFFQRLLKRP